MSERFPNTPLSDVPNYSDLGGGAVSSSELPKQFEKDTLVAIDGAVRSVQDKLAELETERSETVQNGKKVQISSKIDVLQSYLDELCAQRANITEVNDVSPEQLREELQQHLTFESAADYDAMSERDFDDLDSEEIERENLRHYEAFLAKQRKEGENLPVLTEVIEEDIPVLTDKIEEAGKEPYKQSVSGEVPVLTDVIADKESVSISNSEQVPSDDSKAREEQIDGEVIKVSVGDQLTLAKALIDQINTGVQHNVIPITAANEAVDELEQRIHALEQQLPEVESNQKEMLAKTDEVLRQLIRRRGGILAAAEVVTAHSESKEGKETMELEHIEETVLPESVQEEVLETEYLTAKREFKEAKRSYLKTMEEQYRARGIFSKMSETFGIGQKRAFNTEEQDAYDAYLAASKRFYERAKATGVYDKLQQRLAERLKRQHEKGLSLGFETPLAVAPLVAERFVFNPARARLDVQSGFLPERAQKIKERIINTAKRHPYISTGLGGSLVAYGLTVNAPGVIAGVLSGAIGQKFVVGRTEESLHESQEDIANEFMGDAVLDLEQLENTYFTEARRFSVLKNRNRAVATALGLSAATAAEMVFGEPQFTPVSEVVSAQEPYVVPPKAEAIVDPYADFPSPEVVASVEAQQTPPEQDWVESVVPTEEASIGTGSARLPESEMITPRVDYADFRVSPPAAESTPAISSTIERAVPSEIAPTSVASVSETGPDNPAPVEDRAPVRVSEVVAVAELQDRIELRLHKFQYGESIHDYLAESLRKGFQNGSIPVPEDIKFQFSQNPDFVFKYVEEQVPEVSLSLFDWGSDAVTEDQWRAWGVTSGDPTKILSGEVVKVGEILKFIISKPYQP